MQKVGYEPAPLALAYVLGPVLGTALRQSLALSGGSFTIFFTRPIAATAMAVMAHRRGGEAGDVRGEDMFRITAMDHIVLNVPDINRSLAFYTNVLGLEPERLDQFRRGEVRFPSVRVSAHTVIDLFPMKPGEALGGGSGLQNLNHFTMVVDAADFEAFQKHLAEHAVTIEEGPARRWGARGHGQSVYFRDPDGNRIEVRCYPPEA